MPFPTPTPPVQAQAPGPGTNAVAYGNQMQQNADQAPLQMQAMQLANNLQSQLNPLLVQNTSLNNQNLSAQIPGTIADSFNKNFGASVNQGYGISNAVQDKVTQHLSGLNDAGIKHASDLGFFLKTVAPNLDNYGPAKGQMLLQQGLKAGFSQDELMPYIRPDVDSNKLGAIGDSIINASKSVTEERLKQAAIGDQRMRVAGLETSTSKENTQTMAQAQKDVAMINSMGRLAVAKLELLSSTPDKLSSYYSQQAFQFPAGSNERKTLESMAEYYSNIDLRAKGTVAGTNLPSKVDLGAIGNGEIKPMANPYAAPVKMPPVQSPILPGNAPAGPMPGAPTTPTTPALPQPTQKPSLAPTKADADRTLIYHGEYQDTLNNLNTMQKRSTESDADFNARKARAQADLDALTREMKANKIPLPDTSSKASKNIEGQLLYDPVNKTYAKIINGVPVIQNAK